MTGIIGLLAWIMLGICGMLLYWYDKYCEHLERGQDFSISIAFICASIALVIFGLASFLAFVGVTISERGNHPLYRVKIKRN